MKDRVSAFVNPQKTKRWVRTILPVVVIPSVVSLGLCVTVGLIILLSDGGDLSAAAAVGAQFWLTLHQVPLMAVNSAQNLVTISFLPLLPTIVLVFAIRKTVRRYLREERSDEDTRVFVTAAIAVPLLIAIACWGILYDASSVFIFRAPSFWLTLAFVGLVHVCGIVAGLGARIGVLLPFARESMPRWGRAGLLLGWTFSWCLFAGGGILATVMLILKWDVVASTLGGYDSFSDVLGLGLLAILYLPNLFIAAGVTSVGGGVIVGEGAPGGSAEVSAFAIAHGSLPSFPIFAVFPHGPASQLWQLVFIIPLISAFVVLRRRQDNNLVSALRIVSFGALTAVIVVVGATSVAGGELGYLGRVSLSPSISGVAAGLWLAIVGSLIVSLSTGVGAFGRGKRARTSHRVTTGSSAKSSGDSVVKSSEGSAGKSSGDSVMKSSRRSAAKPSGRSAAKSSGDSVKE